MLNFLGVAASVLTPEETTQAITEFKIAEGYFSTILNSQLVIFSLIVGALIGLSWIFTYKVSESSIKKEVKRYFDELKIDLDKKYEKNKEELKNHIESQSKDIQYELNVVKAQIYRTLGQFWDSEKSYLVAFIWWMRAADYFCIADQDELARIALDKAKSSIEQITAPNRITSKDKGEFQEIMSRIDEKKYQIEKDLLKEAFNKVLRITSTATPAK